MKIRLLLAVAALAIGFVLPTFAQQPTAPDRKLREQLLAFVTKYEEAINNGDAAAAAAFFAEDGVLVNDTGPIYGQKAIEKYYADMFQSVHFSNYIITLDQNFPQIIGKASDETWSTGGWGSTVRGQSLGPVERKGYWSVIDTREGDARKIRMLTWNVTPPPPKSAETNTSPTAAQEKSMVDPQVRQQLEAVIMKFVEAYNNRDVATISALHTPDAVEVRAAGGSTRAGTFSGRQAIEKMFAADFALNPPKLVSELVQVYAIDENNICAIANRSAGMWKAYTVSAYIRALDGTWKVHMTYINPL